MPDNEIVQKDYWICPGCLSQNSTSALECDCGIAIRDTIRMKELLLSKEIADVRET